ncbi:MAG: AhpC/TSA family protein [Bacteroidales bacterium]|nr:AhpC/TSA family protein [Bacteroidales bacterium]
MKNFKITILAFISMLFVTACNSGMGAKDFTIHVKMGGLPEGKELLLQERGETGYEVIDTAKVKGNEYVFKGTLGQPKLVYLTSSVFRGAIPVFVEAGDIQVTAHVDSLAKAKIMGSDAHDFYAKINEKLADLDKIWQDFYYGPYRAMSKDEQASNEGQVNLLYDSAQTLKAHFLETELLNNGSQPATPVIALSNIDDMDIVASQAIYDNLSPEVLNSTDAKRMSDRISIIKRSAIGQPLIDFTMNDTLGNPITLSEYANGKYVLIDFWAAWCSPCRRENPNVVANFKKYSDKGFTVFGVSFDQKKENWIKAIKDDGLLWQQVSDLQGWANAAGKLYGIQSIPQNILLDPNGIIFDKNLRGPALGEKLEELLGK